LVLSCFIPTVSIEVSVKELFNILEENEERTMVEPKSYSDPKLQELMNILIDWVNDVLADHRIIVKNLEQDLYDGQVLQKLYGKYK